MSQQGPKMPETNAQMLAIGRPPLTKEQAMADTIRALKECFPDRWERIWNALGKESASDKATASISKAVADDPRAAMCALVGGIVGAALGKIR